MDEIVELMKRQIILAVQCKDFGHTIDGEFRTTPVKIELLELACRDAARAALSALHEARWRIVHIPAGHSYQLVKLDEPTTYTMLAASPVKKG